MVSLIAMIRAKNGFSLIEILVSLLIVSGAIAIMFNGFEMSFRLSSYANFETYASLIAEREIEILKSDLLGNKIRHAPGHRENRFSNKPGFSARTVWSDIDEHKTVRIICTVSQKENTFKLESFLYYPNGAKLN